MKKKIFAILLVCIGLLGLVIVARHHENFMTAWRASQGQEQAQETEAQVQKIDVGFVSDDAWIQNEITIEISGLTESQDFLFLTDQHIAIKTMEDLGSLGPADDRLNSFVNVNGMKSADQFALWIDMANATDVDGVMMCGDMIDYYSTANDTYMAEQVARLEKPYIYAIGNHERFSPEGITDFSDSALYSMFQNNDPAFQVLDCGEFVIVAIDDETYQVNESSFEQFENFVQTNEKPIILMAHVPFYTENMPDLLQQSIDTWGKATVIGQGARDITEISYVFIQMLLNEKHNVVAVLTGDDHFNYSGMMDERLLEYVVEPSYTGKGTMIHVVGKDE